MPNKNPKPKTEGPYERMLRNTNIELMALKADVARLTELVRQIHGHQKNELATCKDINEAVERHSHNKDAEISYLRGRLDEIMPVMRTLVANKVDPEFMENMRLAGPKIVHSPDNTAFPKQSYRNEPPF